MKQPNFWFTSNSLKAFLLRPFGFVYGKVVALRLKTNKPYHSKIPVICVGNICVGGTGKTPICLALADYFSQRGKKVFFLNHGYKSKLQNVLIDLEKHNSKDLSDEAMIFAHKLPTIVDHNRARGAQRAEEMGADIIIMDDGFQNPSLYKQLSFVVFDGAHGVGNGLCMPAGPLRESLKQGLKRADAAVIVGEDKTGLEKQIKKFYPQLPVLHGHVEPTQDLKGIKGIAFAGIGHPNKFFDMLERKGAVLTEKIAFSDHCTYSRKDVEDLIARGQPLLTTLKDAVKIDADLRSNLIVVDIEFMFDNLIEWDALIMGKINNE